MTVERSVEGAPAAAPVRTPGFGEAVRFWFRLGCISFGGPAGQIAIMHAEVVEARRWISEQRFLHALNFCMALPGPEAQQLATYIGYRLHGIRGGLASGGLFVLPSFVLLVALSGIYVQYGTVPEIEAVVNGLGAAVVALVLAAILRVGGRVVRTRTSAAVALVAFAAFVAGAPFPLVVLAGAVLGYAMNRLRPGALRGPAHGPEGDDEPAQASAAGSTRRLLRRRLPAVAVVWLVPLAVLALVGGVFWDLGWFFSLAALVTFGGAYAVLPYVADAAVNRFGWLTTEQMVAGLALGETTPGPLIMVNTFVGYLAGYNVAGGHAAGVLGATVATAATFVPSFVFIFLGAPVIDRVPRTGPVADALAGVTVVVVGAIAALAVFLGEHVLVDDGRLDPFAIALTALAFVAVWRLRASVVLVILACGAAGLGRHLVT